MVLQDWKISTIETLGNAQVFGTADINRIHRLLNGEADIAQVEIDSNFAILRNRLKLRNSANSNDITLSADASQAANILVTFPALTLDDVLVVAGLDQELTSKTLNISDNIITDDTIATGDIPYFDSTAGKMVRLPRGLANQILQMNGTGTGLMWGSGGGGGAWDPNLSEAITNKTIGSDTNIIKDSTTNALGDLLVNNATKYVRRARGSAGTVLQCSGTDILYALVGDSNITPHISSKVTITNKAQLPSSAIYNDQDNFLGAHYYDISGMTLPATPTTGRRRLFANSALGNQLSVIKDDGTVISLEASAWSPTLAEALSNKTIDAETNTLVHVGVAPSAKKVGYWHGTTALGGSGLFNGFLQQPNGTCTIGRSSTSGTWQTLTTGGSSTNTCSIKTLDSFTARNLNPQFKAKFRVPTAANCRIGLGFNSDLSFDQRNSDWLGGQSGAAFVYGVGRQDEASLYLSTNDGSTNSFYSPAIATLVANTVYTAELKFDTTNNKVSYSFNGGAFVDVTSQIPASSTLLGATWGVQTQTGSSRTLDTFYVEVQSDR